jgi:hypothetical protein
MAKTPLVRLAPMFTTTQLDSQEKRRRVNFGIYLAFGF